MKQRPPFWGESEVGGNAKGEAAKGEDFGQKKYFLKNVFFEVFSKKYCLYFFDKYFLINILENILFFWKNINIYKLNFIFI